MNGGNLSPYFCKRSPRGPSPYEDDDENGGGAQVQEGTEDGDDGAIIDESSSGVGAGFKIGGVRYTRPVYIGRSFATDDPGEQVDDFFVSRNQNFTSLDGQSKELQV